jgi:transposase
MVHEQIVEQGGERFGVITRIARQLGIGTESLRNWVNQAEIDGGQRPGVTTEERRRIAELEREVRELRRANEILKAGGCRTELVGSQRPALAPAGSFGRDVRFRPA